MAKIYTKTVWMDEMPTTTPVRYRVEALETTLNDALINVVTPITPGTPVNAANLNHLEDGVDALDTLVDQLTAETLYIRVIRDSATLLFGDGLMTFTIPAVLNTYHIRMIHAAVYTPSSSFIVLVQVHHMRLGQNILSIMTSVDVGEFSSYTAATVPVVNPAYAEVLTGDRLRVDIKAAGTGVKGLDLILTLERSA